jgi:hypothetical protein
LYQFEVSNPVFITSDGENKTMEKEVVYRSIFDNFAKPGEKFGEEWIDKFDDTIIEEGSSWVAFMEQW